MSASPAQRDRINVLITEHEVPEPTRLEIIEVLGRVDCQNQHITAIMRALDVLPPRTSPLPTTPAPAPGRTRPLRRRSVTVTAPVPPATPATPGVVPGVGHVNAEIRRLELPLGTYLIPFREVPPSMRDLYWGGGMSPDYVAIVIKEFKETRYLRYLDTSNSYNGRLNKADSLWVVRHLAADPTRYKDHS